MILAILLGPYAGFLVIASVLTVQALFFADGGLLALGCNIFNLGFFPCFLAYPLIYKPMARNRFDTPAAYMAALVAAIVGLQLGAFAVVLETMASGISDLTFGAFVLLMQPIHLAIGVVEGLATAAVVAFVARARPQVLEAGTAGTALPSLKPVLAALIAATLVIGGAISWFASGQPDGLEWSLEKASGSAEVEAPVNGIHEKLASVQEKTALLPDYGFKTAASEAPEDGGAHDAGSAENSWPAVQAGTSVSGVVGGCLTLLLVFVVSWLVKMGVARKPVAG